MFAQVRVLNKHSSELAALWGQICDHATLPVSEVLPETVQEFVDHQKPKLKTMETDIRDAKRRITLATGPAKKKAKEVDPGEGSGSGSEHDGSD